jgi:hypothetical protein
MQAAQGAQPFQMDSPYMGHIDRMSTCTDVPLARIQSGDAIRLDSTYDDTTNASLTDVMGSCCSTSIGLASRLHGQHTVRVGGSGDLDRLARRRRLRRLLGRIAHPCKTPSAYFSGSHRQPPSTCVLSPGRPVRAAPEGS